MNDRLNLSVSDREAIKVAVEIFNMFGIKSVEAANTAIGQVKPTNNPRGKELTKEVFDDFLKMTEVYRLKEISRNCSNFYHCNKTNVDIERKETVAEHVSSSVRLMDYFLMADEFAHLDELKVNNLLKYHDDVEIITDDTCISKREERTNKDKNEREALPILALKYPNRLREKLLKYDNEFRECITEEAKFAHAIDKMDALIHELKYPQDWGPKGFSEQNVRKWFGPSFEYSPTFKNYFETLIQYLRENNYF